MHCIARAGASAPPIADWFSGQEIAPPHERRRRLQMETLALRRKGVRESSNRTLLGNRQRRTKNALGRKRHLSRKIREIARAWRNHRSRRRRNEIRGLLRCLENLRSLLLLLSLVRDLAAHRAWVIPAEGPLDTRHERVSVVCVVHHHSRPGNALENRPMAADHDEDRHPGKGNPQQPQNGRRVRSHEARSKDSIEKKSIMRGSSFRASPRLAVLFRFESATSRLAVSQARFDSRVFSQKWERVKGIEVLVNVRVYSHPCIH